MRTFHQSLTDGMRRLPTIEHDFLEQEASGKKTDVLRRAVGLGYIHLGYELGQTLCFVDDFAKDLRTHDPLRDLMIYYPVYDRVARDPPDQNGTTTFEVIDYDPDHAPYSHHEKDSLYETLRFATFSQGQHVEGLFWLFHAPSA